MKRRLFKFGVGVVVAGALTSVGIVARDAWQQERSIAEVRPTLTPAALPAILRNVPLVLVPSEGKIDLHEQPGGGKVSLTLDEGQLVLVLVTRAVEVEGTSWFLVELVEQPGRGWLPADSLTLEVTPEVSFNSFQFCLGDASGPTGPCGTSLVQSTAGLWLSWQYQGLEEGDVVQRVLVINGERYQSPPTRWDGPASGKQLVNLLAEHSDRARPGLWTVQFLVNGDMVSEATVQVRPAAQP